MSTLSLDRNTPWVVDEDLPGSVQLCMDDLARDWRRTFSVEPVMRAEGEYGPPEPVVIAVGPQTVESLTGWRPSHGPEDFSVRTLPGINSHSGKTVVAVSGGEWRGLCYALYAVSQHILGVDPFWFWIGQRLSQNREIRLEHPFVRENDSPVFRWRGWFCNDEDLLTGWAASLQKSHGISLRVWDRIFETILRTGGNFVVPGTFLFPDEPQIKRAADRGLAIGQHHIEVLGLNTYQWPDELPYSYRTHPEILDAAWSESVLSYPRDIEVIWSIGYRGRHDRPFWYDDPTSAHDDAARGRIISEAIQRQ